VAARPSFSAASTASVPLRSPDAGVVAPDVEHPEAAEHVEVPAAFVVEQVGALGASPAPVEADRLEHPRELRVDRLRPQLEALVPA
jgi:hypothetical protein